MSNFRGQDRGRGRGGGPPGGRGGPPGGGGRGGPPGGRGGGPGYGGGGGGPPGGRGGPPGGGGFRGGGARGGRGRGDGGPVVFKEGQPVQIDSRLANDAEKKAVARFNQVIASLPHNPRRPLRPGHGTLGKPITLRANFFAVRLPKGPYYEYSIEITPQEGLKNKAARLFQLLEQSPQCRQYVPHIAHDKSNKLVSAKKLPEDLIIRVPFIDEGANTPAPNATTYIVTIKFVQELDLTPMAGYLAGDPQLRDYNPDPILASLNLVLQQHASRTSIRVGKTRYFDPNTDQKFAIGPNGVQAIQGFYASVRPAFNQLMVNLNVCMAPFLMPGKLEDILGSFARHSRGALPNLPPALAKSMKVTTTYLGYKRKKAIKKVGNSSARRTFFSCKELGKDKISVEEYFKRKYNITLQHPDDLPVIDIASPGRDASWVPAELCTVELQPYMGRLSSEETADMIQVACQPPATNARAIMDRGLSKLAFTPTEALYPTNPTNQGFGIIIRQEMATVPARILPAPSLDYKVGRPNVRGGSWNIMDVKFHRGAHIRSWAVMNVVDGNARPLFPGGVGDPALNNLVNGFINKCQKSGMMVEGREPVKIQVELPETNVNRPNDPFYDPNRSKSLATIKNAITGKFAKANKPSFILVLLSREDHFIYPGIKKLCDVQLGVHTLHMLLKPGKNALGEPNKADQYFSNITLKLNTKLGGVNHMLGDRDMAWLKKKKTMVVGIDVTHSSPGSREGTPSIAAVVASVDDAFVQFPAALRLQSRENKEMVDNLEALMIERMQLYAKKNKCLPERVIIYRDGVSEGQFDTVLDQELPQIHSAFKKVGHKEPKPYKPTLTIIICGKRHHARFPATSMDHADPKQGPGNTLPGTIVDQGVTNVYEFDFYLQAHAGLQGTVRPTHYTVVYDENRVGVDEIQQGTHTASYAYARATKAVSLIPPAYYADLACERGRCYLNDFLAGGDEQPSSKGMNRGDREAEKKRVFDEAVKAWGQGLHADLKDSMFYL